MARRRELVKLWRRIAMTTLHQNRVGFRLVPLLVDALYWKKDGTITSGNKRLAREGGGCDEKTIQREVGRFADLGLLVVSYEWVTNDRGEIVKKRCMRLAVPETYRGEVPSDDIEDVVPRTDHGCPSDTRSPVDNRGPDLPDNRGPIFVEHTDSAENDGDAV